MRGSEQFHNAYGIALTGQNRRKLLILLLCLETVLAFSAVGFIELPPISVTTLSVPVILAAMLLGPADGIAVSLVFAFASMWKASLTSVEAGDLIFSPLLSGKPAESLIMALGTRVLFGLIAGLMYRRFFAKERKHRRTGIAVIAVAATVLHALMIWVCMTVFFGAAEANTGSGFARSLVLDNLILFAVTVLAVLGADAITRNKAVLRFLTVTASEDARISRFQKHFLIAVTVAAVAVCALICIHFMSRFVGYISDPALTPDGSQVRRTYSLVLQLALAFAAAFWIIALMFRWVQEYFSVIGAQAERSERVREEIMQNNARIFALEDDFESLYDVELESGSYLSYVKGDFYRNNVTDKLVPPTDFFDDLRVNIGTVIWPEDREGLAATLTREAVRRELAENDRIEYYYRVITESGPVWFRMRVVYKDAEKKDVIIGVFNASNDIAARQLTEQKAQLQEALTFTNFFLDTYVSAYYIDFRDMSCQVYKRTDELEKAYPIISDYFTSLTDYIRKDVHPDDRETLLAAVRPDAMRAILREKSEYSQIFRDMSGGREMIYRMQVIRGAEEDHAAFGFMDITGEVEEQNARRREADEAKKLVESVAASYDVAFAVNMTDGSCRLLKQESELLGGSVSFTDFTEARESLLTVVHPSDRERMRHELDYAVIRENLRARRSRNVTFRMLTDGVTAWHEMNETAIDEDHAALGFAERDTELTKLFLEDKRYDEYFALFVADLDTEMLKVAKNEGNYNAVPVGAAAPYTEYLLRIAGYMDDEPRAFYTRISDPAYVRRVLAAEDRRTYTYKTERLGGERWVDVTSYVILRHEDGTPAMVTLGFSFADALAAEREEQKLALREARDAAEAANRSKTDFLFNMSHDIRTPMNAITGFTNMAIKYIDDKGKVLDCLGKTQKAGAMLLSLINSVLEVSRIESGHAVLDEQPGDVYYSFVNIENTLQELAGTKDISLTFTFGAIRDRYVYADAGRCMRVFVNIISNAIKYTPEGGTVKVLCEQAGEAENGVATYRYTVSDNGIGMSEEFQKHVFEQFSRERTATVSGIQGTGLGLAVVRSFVELMGGTVTVRSRQGEGTVFTVLLPFRLQEETPYTDPGTGGTVSSAPRQARRTRNADFRGCSVLLVEDNELNREIAYDVLTEKGLLVEEAEDGTVAVERLKEKGPAYYDLILMDIQMPQMNGYEATKAIRAMYPDARLPIVALSANAFEEDREASRAAGMDGHVAKPINVKELFGVMAKCLSGKTDTEEQ